jgi:hypothetical protein
MTPSEIKVHPNWLRFMYAYTLATGGSSGLALLLAPSAASSLLNLPVQEPIIGGIAYSVWLACGILCIFGLRSPVKFSPILLFDVAYKAIWLVAVVVPREALGQLPSFAVTMTILYLTIIIGDLVAIPWRYLLAK